MVKIRFIAHVIAQSVAHSILKTRTQDRENNL